MKIWQVVFYSPDMEYSFHATKRQAEAQARTRKAELLEYYRSMDMTTGPDTVQYDVLDWQFDMTRDGVADLLDRFIDQTKLNEN